ncbi:MAG: cupin domain-containing protein [Acidobacteria bacterium]|nr:cupin domain-containing protein [Acidobacteriota bacterium]
MQAKVISTANAEHYKWGGPNGTECDGWYLVRTPELNVIEELMPPGACERRHYHMRARQFFLVLDGELTMEVERQEFVVRQGEGIEIAPGEKHQVINRGKTPLRIIVTSQPPSHGDRTDDEG